MDINSNMIMYEGADGVTKIEVTLENDNLWLSLDKIAELFGRDKSTISRHIKNIFDTGELDESSTVANFATVQNEGERRVERTIAYYNLDVIISVGYRVNSIRGTQFRIWANGALKEYMRKGYAMNDELLKNAGGGTYFRELLDRIKDIRSSEKVFYRQVLDIFATSIDYNSKGVEAITFFKTLQNKMRFATSGNTAAEIVYLRANSQEPFMGLTSFKGTYPTRSEVITAKNYLTEQELKELNAIVSAYLDFAELQAVRKIPMYMKDWVKKLDTFLTASDSQILQDYGKISHVDAENKALAEYEKYKKLTANELSAVEVDFIDDLKRTQKLLEKNKEDKGNA